MASKIVSVTYVTRHRFDDMEFVTTVEIDSEIPEGTVANIYQSPYAFDLDLTNGITVKIPFHRVVQWETVLVKDE